MPPSRQQSPSLASDSANATPRARITRSARSRDSLASVASAPTPSKRPILNPEATPSARSRIPSDRFADRSNTPVRPTSSSLKASATPSSVRHRPSKLSHSLASASSPLKLRKRTDTQPTKMPQISSAKSVSSLSRLAVAESMRQKQSSELDEITKYSESEPIQAFLRIRPPPEDAKKDVAKPYIEVISETEVLMHPPKEVDGQNSRSNARARIHSNTPTTKYVFTKVFDADSNSDQTSPGPSSQATFFRSTTLPLVEELLQGQSGLIFTYGVTNSGKSYTVMGGDEPGQAGILPRAMDVIFNSISGLESKSDIRPAGISGIEHGDGQVGMTPSPSSIGINPFTIPGLSKRMLNETLARTLKGPRVYEVDETKVPVDRNLRYSVWVSYVEVYNEKLFDLLDVPPPPGTGGLQRSESVRGSSWSIAALANAGSDGHNGSSNITLNRRPLSLKNDSEAGGKYVAGLKEVKVSSAKEARDLLIRGQENRAVFGTMANRASSRSHGVFTIKIIREHGGAKIDSVESSSDASSSYTVARLSIVDLAGSERVGNTGLTSGDRLKEAGNINKSLMCLGQCLDTLRKNQARAAAGVDVIDGPPSAWNATSRIARPEHRASTASTASSYRRRMSIVPFRHSKLTELFQGFFTGEGRAVMIVNANPYDTGFDENAHVMKFSAVAKEVGTIKSQPSRARLLPGPREAKHSMGAQERSPLVKQSKTPESDENPDITIIEDDDTEDEDESDPFVDLLVQSHEELRQKLYMAELRCATIESQIREEMANEMEQRLMEMEALYNQRMLTDAERNEHFVNRKIDLLVRANVKQEDDDENEDEDEDDEDNSSMSSEDEDEVDKSLAVRHKTPKSSEELTEESSEESEDEDAQSALEDVELATDSEHERDSDIEQSFASSPDEEATDAEGGTDAEEATGPEDDVSEESEDDSEPESDAQDSSFDITAATALEEEKPEDSSEDEGPRNRRRSSRRATLTKATPRRKSSTSTVGQTKGRRSSRTPFQDRSQEVSNIDLTDISDVSMIAEDCITPKPKRKLRKKSVVQEDDLVEQIGDSSLVEAVYQSSATTAGRRSLR